MPVVDKIMDEDVVDENEKMFLFIFLQALNKNEIQLKTLENSHVSLNIFAGRRLVTPIEDLAEMGKDDAVDFLIAKFHVNAGPAAKVYAKLNKPDRVEKLIKEYNTSLSDVALGYEQGGNFAKANELLKQGNVNINRLVQEAAHLNHTKRVRELLAQGASVNYALYGYALGRNLYGIQLMKNKGADAKFEMLANAINGENFPEVEKFLDKNPEALNNLTFSYALVGDAIKVNEMLERDADRKSAIKGYAAGGFIKEARELLKRDYTFSLLINDTINHIAHVDEKNNAVCFYAFGGHHAEVEKMLQKAPKLGLIEKLEFPWNFTDQAALGYAMARNTMHVNAMLKRGAKPLAAMCGYACAGDLVAADKLLSKYSSKKDEKIAMIVKYFFEDKNNLRIFSNRETILQTFSLLKNLKLREALINSAKLNGFVKGYDAGKLLEEVSVMTPAHRGLGARFLSLFHHQTANSNALNPVHPDESKLQIPSSPPHTAPVVKQYRLK